MKRGNKNLRRERVTHGFEEVKSITDEREKVHQHQSALGVLASCSPRSVNRGQPQSRKSSCLSAVLRLQNVLKIGLVTKRKRDKEKKMGGSP